MEAWTSAVLLTLAIPVTLMLWLPGFGDLVAWARARSPEQQRGVRAQARVESVTRESSGPPRLLFLVPAHNESLLIRRCVQSLFGMRRSHSVFEVRVLLDACTDDTSEQATNAGAVTVDFGHLHPVGKARMLALAAERSEVGRYDAIVIVDADSTVAPDFAEALSANSQLRSVVQQGHHALSNPNESWLTRLAAVLNGARYGGQLKLRARAGLNAVLSGNGMCIGSEVIRRNGLHCSTIKEDLELYVRYTLAGERISFCPEAVVYAQEARSLRQAGASRTRWEAGRWSIIRRYARRVLFSRLPWAQKIDVLAEIMTHGPVVHAALALGVASAYLVVLPEQRALAIVPLASLLPFAIWIAGALARDPAPHRAVGAMVLLPAYAVWRIGILLVSAVAPGRRRWTRSPRHGEVTGIEPSEY